MKITSKRFYEEAAEDGASELFVEVGSGEGASVAFLAKTLQDLDKPFVIFSVDKWTTVEREAYHRLLVISGTRKDVFDMICDSKHAASKFQDGSIDVCFVNDEKDLPDWVSKVKSSGRLAVLTDEGLKRIK